MTSSAITTDYAAISYGSTPETSQYVRCDGTLMGAVQRAYDGTWIALTPRQILDGPGAGTVASGVSREAAIAALIEFDA